MEDQVGGGVGEERVGAALGLTAVDLAGRETRGDGDVIYPARKFRTLPSWDKIPILSFLPW
jgi:hypothetical protein